MTTPRVIASSWVPTGNVRPLAATLSLWVAYDFDETDWSAISYGLEGTDADADRWFSYPIVGSPELTLVLARHLDADPVMVRVEAPPDVSDELRYKTEAALTIFNCFEVGTR